MTPTDQQQYEQMMKVWAQRREQQLPAWEAWHDKFDAGKMTCREFIDGPDFDSIVLKDESKLLGVEMKLDGIKEPYEDRNRECDELRKTFFLDLLKISPDDMLKLVTDADLEKEVIRGEEDEEDETINADPIALDIPDKFPGYAVWEGEEIMVIFEDGERIGSFSTSCRGNISCQSRNP